MRPRKLAFPGVADPWATRAVFAIRAIAQRINDNANEWLAPLGLTAAKYNYLVVLYGAPRQAMTLSELGAYIHTTSASVTGVVDALERDGFVERTKHAKDRRSIFARLTPKGKNVIERAFPLHHRNIEVLMSELSAQDRKRLVGFLAKLAGGIDTFERRKALADVPKERPRPLARARAAKSKADRSR
jgi:DNA-binding MarR family transcriptional regulator